MEMSLNKAMYIIKNEISLDSRGVYRAIEKETDSKKCAINRMRRLNALNKLIGNETGKFPYLNWLPVAQEENDFEEGYLCICGHPIATSHVLIYKPDRTKMIAHGSECIKRVRTEFADEPEAEEFVNNFKSDIAKMKRTCPTCKGVKRVKDAFCGDEECKLTKFNREQAEFRLAKLKKRKLKEEAEEKTKPVKDHKWFFHFKMDRECLV
jgi:hypothetical protein